MGSGKFTPDSTAVRVALWRAMHVQVDAPPHVLDDEVGLKLVDPDSHWRERPDMHPQGTRGYRAAIVARARFIEDTVEQKVQQGLRQYVILGAGLDTFAQRKPEIASRLSVFEIDKPETQGWKQQRLAALGWGNPDYLHFVPVNFEAGESWWTNLHNEGFDPKKPALVSSTGVAMYLTRGANLATLHQMRSLAPGSTFVLSFILPPSMVEESERSLFEMVIERAKASGTPFLSLFKPAEIIALAKEAGFEKIQHVSRAEIIQKYFANRSDGLVPSSGEELLILST